MANIGPCIKVGCAGFGYYIRWIDGSNSTFGWTNTSHRNPKWVALQTGNENVGDNESNGSQQEGKDDD